MGYIIPVQPIQSQIYANRLLMDEYNFAYINSIYGIKMKSVFEDYLERQEHALKKEEDQQLSEQVEQSNLPLYKGFIQPNPINLSPKIAEINGKGNTINLYI